MCAYMGNVCSFFLLFPIIQFWQVRFKITARLLRRKVFVLHMSDEKIRQLLQARVNEITVRIAPLTVFFIERTVSLFTDRRIIQSHTTALTNQLSRRTKKRVDRNVKQF